MDHLGNNPAAVDAVLSSVVLMMSSGGLDGSAFVKVVVRRRRGTVTRGIRVRCIVVLRCVAR